MQTVGYTSCGKRAAEIFKIIDDDGSGSIDKAEFVEYCMSGGNDEMIRMLLAGRLFDLLDENGNGDVRKSELIPALLVTS
jgi:Ca2+-binding EF-hand superfamily protein